MEIEKYYRDKVSPFDKKELKSGKIEFQLLDYFDTNTEYEEGKEFVINLFGVNKAGNSVCVIVDGFKPFFYIKAPEGVRDVTEFLASMKVNFDNDADNKGRYWIASKSIVKEECQIVSRKNFYGYQRKKDRFFKISFSNSMGYHMFKKLMSETVRIRNRDVDLEIFEGNFDPVLRFFQMRSIQPSGWVNVSDFESDDGFSHCQINVRVHWESISGVQDNDDVAPIIQASYDIECYSIDPDVFPLPEIKGNVVTQIATAFKKYGEEDFYLKHIITLKQCAPIKEKDGEPPIVVESYDTEKEVLAAWSRLLVNMDPDIIYSYNGDGFDGNYLYKRAEVCRAKTELLRFGKLKDVPGKLNCSTFTSGAYGSTDFKRLVIPGRVNFDLLVYMKREFKLSSYKLDSVAEKYLSQNKNPMTPRQIFEFFESGDPEKIKTLADYAIQDTLLPQRLIDKLSVLINQIEMSKITLVPIKFLWERGQQIKVFSQIIQRTTQKGYLIPTKKYGYIPPGEEKFQGATVLEPATGSYFDPVVTLDFQSLYPSIIRAHNFCYSTIVLDKDNLRGDEEIEDVVWGDDDEKYHFQYVQNREISVLPELLSDLFTARVSVRAKMKSITDPFILSVMDKKQLAIKVSMNSVYGFLAAQMMKCKPIAASVTAIGRQMIEKTKNYIETNYDASTIVYGDSVARDTPILLRNIDTKEIVIKTIGSIGNGWVEYPGFKINSDTIRNEKQMGSTPHEVWTDMGWAKIRKVIKHKTIKKMFRVITRIGCVDVTEDHSLCTPDLEKIKPEMAGVGQDLLHSFPKIFPETCSKITESQSEDLGYFMGGRKLKYKYDIPLFSDGFKIVPQDILNSPRNIRFIYWTSFYKSGGRTYGREINQPNFLVEGKEAAQGMYYLLKSLGYNIHLNNFNIEGKSNLYSLKHIAFSELPEIRIKKMFEIPSSSLDGDYVYDLETEVGRFQAGIGGMIVSNTDSVFCKFNLDHIPKEKQMAEAFRLGKEAADACTDILFKKPIKLEFEKVFNPLLLFGKKMYIGQLFGTSPDTPDYIDKKGVVSKRRDNTPLTRRVYDETVKIIMEYGKDGVGKAIEHVKYEVHNLLLDKTDIKELTISKTLRSDYKSPNLPHVVVAKKMSIRDPGSAPRSNDRVDYVFIENESKKQFEKAEDPAYVVSKKIKLDSLYYVEHQLKNPLCQVLGLVMDDPEDFFRQVTSGYRLKQKRRLLELKQDKEGQTRITDFFKPVRKMVILESDEE